jgi:hypothetical protein
MQNYNTARNSLFGLRQRESFMTTFLFQIFKTGFLALFVAPPEHGAIPKL